MNKNIEEVLNTRAPESETGTTELCIREILRYWKGGDYHHDFRNLSWEELFKIILHDMQQISKVMMPEEQRKEE